MSASRPRALSADTLIALPRLSGISAARLISELLTAAKAEKKLPPFIVPDRDELATTLEALQVELAKRVSGEGEDTPRVAAADWIEDNAYGALFDFLSAWARLPADQHPESAAATEVLQSVFAGGLAFLAVRPHNEWQEAEIRNRLIAEKGHDATIERLGGKAFLAHLGVAHKAYGEALGITTVNTVVESPAIRVARDAAVDVIRGYVLRVAALVRKSDPQSEALSQRLLAPIVNWRESPAKPGATPEPAAPPPAAPAIP
ncbi:MAG: hypothetical protein ABJE95_12465 [Byssovorax sp.]